ncbi:MAG: FecR domain-containing protein [Rikenellaceae bacterium]
MDNKIWEIISAELNGEVLDTDESSLLRQWLEADSANFDVYQRLKCFYKEQSIRGQIDVKKAYNIVRYGIKQRETNKRKIFIQHWWVAASFVIILIASLLLVSDPFRNESSLISFDQQVFTDSTSAILKLADGKQIMLDKYDSVEVISKYCTMQSVNGVLRSMSSSKNNKAKLALNSIETPTGKDFRIILDDGTQVWLNAGSRLTFPSSFSKNERRLFLEGEACFKVTRASDRPFIVETKKMDVQVLGTCFNIRAYNDEENVYTTLVKGSVQVMPEADNIQPVKLEPCQQYSLNIQSMKQEVKVVDPCIYIAWIDNMFAFKNQRLENVMFDIAKWYDIKFEFKDELAADIRISGNIERDKTLDNVLDMIVKLEKVEIVKLDKKYVISSK